MVFQMSEGLSSLQLVLKGLKLEGPLETVGIWAIVEAENKYLQMLVEPPVGQLQNLKSVLHLDTTKFHILERFK